MNQAMDTKARVMMWVMIGQIARLVLTIIVAVLAWSLWPDPGRVIGFVGMGALLFLGLMLTIAKAQIKG